MPASAGTGQAGIPRFAKISAPKISVVIPVLNQWRLTRDCLRSIEAQGNAVPFEVVVVDNGSSDETVKELGRIENIVVKRREVNLGFVEPVIWG